VSHSRSALVLVRGLEPDQVRALDARLRAAAIVSEPDPPAGHLAVARLRNRMFHVRHVRAVIDEWRRAAGLERELEIAGWPGVTEVPGGRRRCRTSREVALPSAEMASTTMSEVL
jgi:hypothetical protein